MAVMPTDGHALPVVLLQADEPLGQDLVMLVRDIVDHTLLQGVGCPSSEFLGQRAG
jgi:hypothetical protein